MVSIIVPVYNSEKFISRCIESILAQSYKNYELLLIDDGSIDTSPQIIKKYSESDSRIRAIIKENEGVAQTRNMGIKEARGEYILFLDNDDYVGPDYIKQYVERIENTNSDAVFGGYKRVNPSGKIIQTKRVYDSEWSKYTIPTPWAKIFNREYLVTNKIEFLQCPIGEDIYFIISLLSHNPKISFLGDEYYCWFFNDESVSNTLQKGMKQLDIIPFLDKLSYFDKGGNELFRYFIERYAIWFYFFSGRDASQKDFLREYYRIEKWLRDNNYYSKISPFSVKIKGEIIRDRIVVKVMRTIRKLHLEKMFAKIYCNG